MFKGNDSKWTEENKKLREAVSYFISQGVGSMRFSPDGDNWYTWTKCGQSAHNETLLSLPEPK